MQLPFQLLHSKIRCRAHAQHGCKEQTGRSQPTWSEGRSSHLHPGSGCGTWRLYLSHVHERRGLLVGQSLPCAQHPLEPMSCWCVFRRLPSCTVHSYNSVQQLTEQQVFWINKLSKSCSDVCAYCFGSLDAGIIPLQLLGQLTQRARAYLLDAQRTAELRGAFAATWRWRGRSAAGLQ